MSKSVIGALLLAVVMTGVAIGYFLNPVGVPPVQGYLEGKEIRFIHTETSDPKVAALLTKMMGSPVLVVPSLAQVPESMSAKVYVFKNGIRGEGPFGFQPDVFDSPPGSKDYTPLRKIVLLTWKNASEARELRSATEVEQAISKGQLAVERPGVVVNMPLLTWPAGRR